MEKHSDSAIYSKRCVNHSSRESVAICPVCSKTYCRECITEHKGKMLCRNCLEEQIQKNNKAKKNRTKIKATIMIVLFVTAFFSSWFFFALTGYFLASMPQKYHLSKIFEGSNEF